MGLFDFEDAHTKITKRIRPLEDLATKINGSFINGVELIQSKFDIIENKSDLKNCNAITGEIQGFEYCFIEFYHQGHGKNDHSEWVSKVSLRLNKDFPNFNMTTKNSAYASMGCGLLFGLIFFMFPLGLMTFLIVHMIIGGRGSEFFFLIPFGFFALLFMAVGYLIMHTSIKAYKDINNQSKYNIFNPRFREKYVIFSEDDINKIKQTFNENVVSKIVDAKPGITSIECHNKCLSARFGHNELLSYESCNKYLGALLKQAKILEEVE